VKPKTSLASPGELERLVRALCQDALAIVPMYGRLHSLGLEPPRGDAVHASGSGQVRPDGSVTGYAPELAVESDRAASRRDYARWIANEVAECARRLDKIRQGLEVHVGPGPGFRQPTTPARDAIVASDELTASLANQGARLRRGQE